MSPYAARSLMDSMLSLSSSNSLFSYAPSAAACSGKHKCQYDKYRCETLFHMSHHVALSAQKPDVKAPFCARAFPFFLLFTLNRHAALSVQKSNKKTACCLCRFLSFIFHTIPPAESPSLLPLHSVLQLLYRQN